MLNGAYHLLIIIVAVWSVVTGYRKGLLRQIGSVLGVAFGIVAARIGAPEFLDFFDRCLPAGIIGFKRRFLVETVTCSLIYLIVGGIVNLFTFLLARLVGILSGGVLVSIAGALFRLFQYLIFLSIFYNILVDLNPSGELTRSSRQHDGNVVEGVMKIAPAVLGFPGGEEVGYIQQLEDAKKIS